MLPLLPVTRIARPLIGLFAISTTEPAMLCHWQPSCVVLAVNLSGFMVNGKGDSVNGGWVGAVRAVCVGPEGCTPAPTTGVFVTVGVGVSVRVGVGLGIGVGVSGS